MWNGNLLVALVVLLLSYPASVNADSWRYYYIVGNSSVYFETLGEAEASMRSGHPPSERLQRVSVRTQGSTRKVYRYEVPKQLDPIFHSTTNDNNCGGETRPACRSPSEIAEDYRKNWPPPSGYCGISSSVIAGTDPSRYAWRVGGIPYGTQYALVKDSFRYLRADVAYVRNRNRDTTWPINHNYWNIHRYDWYQCPPGYKGERSPDNQSAWCGANSTREIYAYLDQTCDDAPTGGNPCNIITGNKSETEVDYQSPGLQFSRTYNSSQLSTVVSHDYLSQGWRHNFQRVLLTERWPNGTIVPTLYVDSRGQFSRAVAHGTGQYRLVGKNGATILFDAGLQRWIVKRRNTVEFFDTDGRLREITENGRTTALTYIEDQLLGVAAWNGASLYFEYEEGLLNAVVLPDGAKLRFEYEEIEPTLNSTEPRFRLVRTIYPDDSRRTYHYENALPEYMHHLTGISDENGERYSTFHYDDSGLVTGSERAGGTQRIIIERKPDGTIDVTDPNGQTSTYRHTVAQQSLKFASVEGGPCATCSNTDQSRTYDSNGYVKSSTDLNGVVTEYTRDSFGRELSRIKAKGTPQQRTISTQWNTSLGLPARIADPGRITEYTYDANGNRLSQTITDTASGESRTTSWTYNSFGQVLTVDGPRTDVNDVTTYTYDGQGNLETVTNALGHVTRYTQYDPHGNPLQIIDPNGVVTELEYDLRQRLVRRTVAAGTESAATTHFEYDLAGQLIRTTLPNGAWIAYKYDAAHRMTAISNNLNNRIDYVLDAMGNRVEEKVSGADGSTFRETFRTYNQLNRLVVESGPEGSVVEYGYDAEGNRTETTDAFSNTTISHYDALGRLFETVDALSGVTSYGYDPRDNLTQVVDPRGVTTSYVYNGFNELIETRSPDAGTTTYRYDAAGNRISQTDARGITVHYEYDALNRLTFIDYPGTDQDIRHTYDQGPNGIGRLARIDDETGYTEYSYDVRGNLSHKLSVVNSDNGEHYLPIGYSLDVADNLTGMTYPSGDLIEYQRDAAGRVTGISLTRADSSKVNLVTQIQYAPFGPVTARTFGNGITETRFFDREGRITRIQSDLLDYSYAWNAVSNITAISDNLDSTRTQNFDYDALYRLTDAAGIYGHLNWQYDAVGNRTFQSDNGADTLYGYESASNRLANLAGPEGNVVYQYDEAGNTLDDGKSTFDYDARNRFVEADGQYRYAHNALGQRVTKPRFQTSIPGDLDGDGVIDENDLLLLRDILRGRAPANPAADCNGDGVVDNRDTRCIANQIGGSKSKGRSDVGAPSGANLSTMDASASSAGPGTIVGQIFFAYDESGHLIGEYDELGNVIREYVWLGDQPIAMFQDDGVYYIHSDHLNTPKVVTDENQSVVWKADYQPFGDVTEIVSTVDMPLRFAGQYQDEETGLHYNYYRSYDTATGRYTQSDPIGLKGGPNTYAYVMGNPIMWIDPLGLLKCTYAIQARQLTCTNDAGESMSVSGQHVKAGKGECQDNPECVDKKDEGPLPPGDYRIHEPGYSPNRPKWLYLQPSSSNTMHGRDEFFIHGWGVSNGCITIYFNADFKKLSDWAAQDGGGTLSVGE